MRRALFLWLLPLACAHAPAPAPAPAPPRAEPPAARCENLGLVPDELLAEGNVVALGEIHGTAESPQAVGDLACQALALGREVILALEIPEEEAPRIEAFLSTGEAGPLLQGNFWRRSYQDGRSSRAMRALLERARSLQRAGYKLQVLAMDGLVPGADRDSHMAERVLAARERAPKAVTCILVGNIHARTKLSLPRSMAYRLKQAGAPVVAVFLAYGGGTAWLCDIGGAESCGEHPLGGADRGAPRAFTREPSAVADGFDGGLYLGAAHASPPAVNEARPSRTLSPP